VDSFEFYVKVDLITSLHKNMWNKHYFIYPDLQIGTIKNPKGVHFKEKTKFAKFCEKFAFLGIGVGTGFLVSKIVK